MSALPPRWGLPAILLLAAAIRAEGAEGVEVGDFYNVVAPSGADPWVIRQDDGYYYATVTTGSDVSIIRSRTLSGLGGGERKVAWRPPPGQPYSRSLWAPELHRLGGKWYAYVAADDGENANHRMYALENEAADPFEGEFRLKGKVFDPAADRWAIDGTVLSLEGRLYFLWSGWEGEEDVRQDLYIAPMSDPWTLSGPRVAISKPTQSWEGRGGPPLVNEGPQFLVRNGKVFVVYSASGSWTDHYCLGLLSAPIDGDLLSPASWTKHPEPAFASGNGVYGPGHCSFVASPDGSEDWIVYHSARHQGAGWSRLLRAQRFGWSAGGLPDFGLPALPDRPIPIPSGEPRRRRLEAESAHPEGATRATPSPGASGGSVAGLLPGQGAITFEFSADAPGPHLAALRFANAAAARRPVTLRVEVNGEGAGSLRCEPTGPDSRSVAFLDLELAAGMNRIRITAEDHPVDLDCLDLAPIPARLEAAR